MNQGLMGRWVAVTCQYPTLSHIARVVVAEPAASTQSPPFVFIYIVMLLATLIAQSYSIKSTS